LKRREVITLLSDAAAWPLAPRAQNLPGKLPTIGLLSPAIPAAHGPWIAALMISLCARCQDICARKLYGFDR
jgi:hypothetical protein